ncbi:hypothetical protein LWI29_021647 [Acer saccharum]|uniref:CCHC-type domain-containing protein n=1 Tax=Acer saccharum TaxID=4024 RepID=A0AA39SRW3_ACESA|nr:hypothetical protein LWI29_021647 [Acer saccharum]
MVAPTPSPSENPTIINVTPASSTALRSNEFHLITINISAQAPLKLTTSNYMSWKIQFQTLFIGYDLLGYIDGSKPCPASTLTVNTVSSPNPAYGIWVRQDQLIMNAIIGSLSPTIISFVASAKTSMEAWNILSNTYAKPSRGRIKQIKLLLKNSTKGTQSITEFLHSVKSRADELALLGAPVTDEDLTDRILDDLDDEYKELVRAVQARDNPISFDELHEKLLTFEASLYGARKDPTPFPATANPANRFNQTWKQQQNGSNWRPPSQGNTGWRPSQHNSFRPPSSPHSGPPNRGQQQPLRPYLGRCQVCGTQGHTAKRCPSFHMVPTQSPVSGLPPLSPNQPTPWQPRAHFAANSFAHNPAWLLDSGASHHVTTDLSNLSLHTPYNGSDNVMIGDGTGLSITNTGSSSLSTSNKTYTLNDVLCVPNMKKNLISISQFCKTNAVSVEFLSTCFYVKDLRTGTVLLTGTTRDGVYEWPALNPRSSPILAFSGVKTSTSNWHHRLGHPAFPILRHVLLNYNLDLSSPLSKDPVCPSCHCNKSHKLPFSSSSIVTSRPLEVIFSDLKIFGCLCYPWLRPYSSHKLEPRSTSCVFLGYSLSQSAYLCFDPSTSRVFVSRHVQFVESIFPYKSLHVSLPRLTSASNSSWIPSVITVSCPSTTSPHSLSVASPSPVVRSPDPSLCGVPYSSSQADPQPCEPTVSIPAEPAAPVSDVAPVSAVSSAPTAASLPSASDSALPPKYMNEPTSVHWDLVKRLLRYLCRTLDDGIVLYRDSTVSLHAFSDADWAGNKDDFSSTSAYVVYLGRTPISWSSKKQTTIARSSTEAEYRSVAATAAEINWVCFLLTDLGLSLSSVPVIYCDNVGATQLCSNPVFHSRMKHVAVDYHFIRDQVQFGSLRVAHVSSKDQLADALTKPLPRPLF